MVATEHKPTVPFIPFTQTIGETFSPQGSVVAPICEQYEQKIELIAPAGSSTGNILDQIPKRISSSVLNHSPQRTIEDEALDPTTLVGKEFRIFIEDPANLKKDSNAFFSKHYPHEYKKMHAKSTKVVFVTNPKLREPSPYGAMRVAIRILRKDPYSFLRKHKPDTAREQVSSNKSISLLEKARGKYKSLFEAKAYQESEVLEIARKQGARGSYLITPNGGRISVENIPNPDQIEDFSIA